MSAEARRTISLKTARRLAVMCQRLAGPRLSADPNGIMDVMRDIRYLQIDPMRIVAPSHNIVLWSRLGPFDLSHLDSLLWNERRLFEDWAQAASIVLTEDYPMFRALKRTFAAGNQAWAKKIRDWMEKNKGFSEYILSELKQRGPMFSKQFEDRAVENWNSSGWTSERNVDMMLFFLKAQGRIMVAGRAGNRRLWDLTEHFLPKDTPKEMLSDREVTSRAAQLSLRALGVARSRHIQQHFIRGCYKDLDTVLAELEAEKQVIKAEIGDGKKRRDDPWYIHADTLPLLDSLEAGNWEPRTTLLSPFDNLISYRQRTEELFDFHFRFEVYTPKAQRKYGCYVMPILHGDRFAGRVDPAMDRKKGKLLINAVYAETDAPETEETAKATANAIEELGVFLGAKQILYSQHVPHAWKRLLH